MDDEEVISEFEKGCGCGKSCYKQFSVPEVKEFRLSMRELTKTARDMFLIGKLQLLIRDPSHISTCRIIQETAANSCICF